MLPFSLPSFAKINLLLRVLGRRDDGFHEICTIFQTVSLADSISFELSDGLTLESDDPRLPPGSDNLIIKAAERLREASGTRSGARLRLQKSIPSPGGLGGGSSNAAATLTGLARLWDISISAEDLALIAAELGSDVPFFLTGGTALGWGRGELIEGLPDITFRDVLIVTPPFDVSTAAAFQRLAAPSLTSDASKHILTVCRSSARSFDQGRPAFDNDFESSVFADHPEIGKVKARLLDLGAIGAALSGSGASVFAVFDNTVTRQTAQNALGDEPTWRKFAVTTISRDEFREAMHL